MALKVVVTSQRNSNSGHRIVIINYKKIELLDKTAKNIE